MTYETLQYVDALGATQEVAMQSLCSAGAVGIQFLPRSHAPSEFHISLPQPPDIAIAIPFKSRCIVRACRASATGAANSFSGGSIIFQGRRTDNSGEASRSRVITEIVLSDALWDLQKITFQILWRRITGGTLTSPTYTNFYYPDLILFQPAPGVTYAPAPVNNTITTWQQIQDIINYGINYATGDNAVQLQLGACGFTPRYCNWYPVRSMKCFQALTVALRPHPGVYTEIDYTTTPPTIYFRDRAHMTAVTLPYESTDANGITHIATGIQPLNELVPDSVAIYYKITGSFNGQPVISTDYDIYPVGSVPSLLRQEYSVDVTGSNRQETIVDFESDAFDPTDKNLWREKVPSLKQIADGGQVANDSDPGALTFLDTAVNGGIGHPKCITVEDELGNTIDLTNYQYVTEQDVFAWMKLSGGTPAGVVKATVKAFFTYNKISTISATDVTDTFKEHCHHFRVVLTNAPSGRYILPQTLNTGEAIPANLAQGIFTELQDLQWKVKHQVFQIGADAVTVPTIIKPGKHKVNLSGGLVDWTTMNAVPESISIKFLRTGDGRLYAEHSISCGPVNHLEPAYLVQLFALFTNRDLARIDANQRLTGSTSSSQVDLTNTGARENTIPAEPIPQATNHVYETGGAIAGQVSIDAKKISDILGATTPTPMAGFSTSDLKKAELREIQICSEDGGTGFTIVPTSGFYTKP